MPLEIVQTKRLFLQVAEQIAGLIGKGEFPVGERLPAERELARQLGVSRPTVREAMIALELSGLVEVRVGSGILVIGKGPLTKSANSAISQDVGPFEILEARRIVECAVARFAAQMIEEPDFAVLEAALDLMAHEHREGFKSEEGDRDFHVGIAQATRNGALVRTVNSLWDIRESSALWAKLHERVRAAQIRPASFDDHQRILGALRTRDPEAASAAMDAHLLRVADDLWRVTEAEFSGEIGAADQERGRRAVGL